MAAPAVDFAAMLADARRHAAQRRLAALRPRLALHSGSEDADASAISSPPCAASRSALPTTALPWPKPISASDLFNLLQTASEQPEGGQERLQGTPVRLVDLRGEDSFRERHIRQASRVGRFLEELQRLGRELRQRTQQSEEHEAPRGHTSRLPEKVVFYAGSGAEDGLLSSHPASGLHGAGGREARGSSGGDVRGKTGGDDAENERAAADEQTAKDDGGERESGGVSRRTAPDSPGCLVAAAVQELSQVFEANQTAPNVHRLMPPRLFVLKGGFADFASAYPFLCLSAEESDAAAYKMHSAAATALMSYPREVCRFSGLTPSSSQPGLEPAAACTPFFGLYLGTMLHAISRGVRRRLRISTVLDLSAEGLPLTLGNCSCAGCTSGGCRWREGGADERGRVSARGSLDSGRAVRAPLPRDGEEREWCSRRKEDDEWAMESLDVPRGLEGEGAEETNRAPRDATAEVRGEEEPDIAEKKGRRRRTPLPLRVIRPIDKFLLSDQRSDSQSACCSSVCSSGRSTGGLETAAATAATRYALPLQLCVEILTEALAEEAAGARRAEDFRGGGEPRRESRSIEQTPQEETCQTTGAEPGGGAEEEGKPEVAKGSVLVVHSSDGCSLSGSAAVLAAFLWRKRAQSARNCSFSLGSGAGRDKTWMKAAGSSDQTSLALALLMKKWPTMRLEPQHMRQLKRFCESENAGVQARTASGAEAKLAENRTRGGDQHDVLKERGRGEGQPVDMSERDASGGLWSAVQQGQTTVFQGAECESERWPGRELDEKERVGDKRMMCLTRRDAPQGERERSHAAEAGGLHAGIMLRLTLDLCRLPSAPVYLSGSGALASFDKFGRSRTPSLSVALLGVLTAALPSRPSTAGPEQTAVHSRERQSLACPSPCSDAEPTEEPDLNLGFAELLRAASKGTAVSAARCTPLAMSGASSSTDASAARLGSSFCQTVTSVDEVGAETAACLRRVQPVSDRICVSHSRGTAELSDKAQRQERVQVPLEEVWRVLATCAGCWVIALKETGGVVTGDLHESLRDDGELGPRARPPEDTSGDDPRKTTSTRGASLEISAGTEAQESKSMRIWRRLTELTHTVRRGMRENGCPSSNCMTAVGAFLVNLSVLWETLRRLPGDVMLHAVDGAGCLSSDEASEGLPLERHQGGRPGRALREQSTEDVSPGGLRDAGSEPSQLKQFASKGVRTVVRPDADLVRQQKDFKKELVSLLVFVVGSEAAALLQCAAGTGFGGGGSARNSSGLQAHLGGAEGGAFRGRGDSANRAAEELFFGRPTLPLRLALTALYGSVINPLFVGSQSDDEHVPGRENGLTQQDGKEQRESGNASLPRAELRVPASTSKSHRRGGTTGTCRKGVSASRRRLKELFRTESLKSVLDLAEVWSATHPREGTEALQLLQQLHKAEKADQSSQDAEGDRVVPASLALVLRPIVVVANEVEGFIE